MSDQRKRYRVYHLLFDMEGFTEGDFRDFRRALDRLEEDFPGTHLVGSHETHTWPSILVRETSRPEPGVGKPGAVEP